MNLLLVLALLYIVINTDEICIYKASAPVITRHILLIYIYIVIVIITLYILYIVIIAGIRQQDRPGQRRRPADRRRRQQARSVLAGPGRDGPARPGSGRLVLCRAWKGRPGPIKPVTSGLLKLIEPFITIENEESDTLISGSCFHIDFLGWEKPFTLKFTIIGGKKGGKRWK